MCCLQWQACFSLFRSDTVRIERALWTRLLACHSTPDWRFDPRLALLVPELRLSAIADLINLINLWVKDPRFLVSEVTVGSGFKNHRVSVKKRSDSLVHIPTFKVQNGYAILGLVIPYLRSKFTAIIDKRPVLCCTMRGGYMKVKTW